MIQLFAIAESNQFLLRPRKERCYIVVASMIAKLNQFFSWLGQDGGLVAYVTRLMDLSCTTTANIVVVVSGILRNWISSCIFHVTVGIIKTCRFCKTFFCFFLQGWGSWSHVVNMHLTVTKKAFEEVGDGSELKDKEAVQKGDTLDT